jgi:hypothetical protein
MKIADLFMELVATYRKHGWELRRALLQPATLGGLRARRTTGERHGSYGCWRRRSMRCLRLLKQMKRKKNERM